MLKLKIEEKFVNNRLGNVKVFEKSLNKPSNKSLKKPEIHQLFPLKTSITTHHDLFAGVVLLVIAGQALDRSVAGAQLNARRISILSVTQRAVEGRSGC